MRNTINKPQLSPDFFKSGLGNLVKAFTLVELIVVITILAILATVAFVSYEWQVEWSRNTARQSDISALWSALKNHKLKNWSYPNPWDYFNIMNNWTGNIVAKQWFMNSKVYSTEITTTPLDPNYKIPYLYSVTKNNWYYELATIIEPLSDAETIKTYLVWDYQTVTKDVLPTILLATSTWANNNIEIASWTTAWNINRLTFLANNSSLNVPYNDANTTPTSTATTFDSIFSESWVTYSQFPWYSSCQEIYEAWRSIWSWSYQVLDINWAVTNTGCSMNFNFCSTQPSYTNASFTTWTPTSINQTRQNTNARNPCYYACTWWYTGNDCSVAPNFAASCITAWQTLTSTSVYSGCNTRDIIVCSWTSTWYILSACNVWASVAWTWVVSYWNYFQWWNNWWTPSGTIAPSTTFVNTTWYWPGNYYNNITFIWWGAITSPFDWSSIQNDNLWWSWWSVLQRQGPCNTWYHIPTQTEWAWIVTVGWWGTTLWTSMWNKLLLPFAGTRSRTTGTMSSQTTDAYYWATTPSGTSANDLKFLPTVINVADSKFRLYSYTIRCFKN